MAVICSIILLLGLRCEHLNNMAKRPTSSAPTFFSALGLRNFRGFKSTGRVPLAPLTFLVGPNSSGKSSFADAIMFLLQSRLVPVFDSSLSPRWSGALVDLGSFPDTVFGHDDKLTIEIDVQLTPPGRLRRYGGVQPITSPVEYGVSIRTSPDNPVGRITRLRVKDPLSGVKLVAKIGRSKRANVRVLDAVSTFYPERFIETDFFYSFQFHADRVIKGLLANPKKSLVGKKAALRRIAASIHPYPYSLFANDAQKVTSGRAAPRRWYAITGAPPDAPAEAAPRQSLIYESVSPSMVSRIRSGARFKRARSRIGHQKLEDVLHDLNIGSRISSKRLSAYHSTIEVTDSITKVTSKLIELGYGASQVIPVIAACLSDSRGPLFVEQPEIHLHPKAQGTVADLLCRTSRSRQVIVETHSVHMLNRARLMIADGEIRSSDVIIHYIDRTSKGSRIRTITLDHNGEFESDWPAGFFDERYQDTMALLSLKKD